MSEVVYVGGYGSGITIFQRDGHHLVPSGHLDAPDPSFLTVAADRGWLFACHESEATVGAYAIEDGGALVARGSQPTGGADPCHVLLHPAGYLVTTNYGGGSVAVHPLAPDGTLRGPTQVRRHSGSGPDPDRQAGPHPHESVLVSGAVVVIDLGTDRLTAYRLAPGTGTLDPTGDPFGRAPAGAGPRHAAVHPSGRWYVSNELDSTVSSYTPDFDLGGLRLLDSVPASAADPRESCDPGKRNYPSGIALSADGTHLYVANRGADTLTTFQVAASGGLRQVAEIPCDGCWPRDFSIVDDLLLVANQKSGSVTGFRLDDGLPAPLGVLAEVPGAACAVPVHLPT